MADVFAWMLDPSGLTPHGFCPLGEPWLIWTARLIETLSRPFAVGHHQIALGTSVGIALSPANEADGETLLKNADMALYARRRMGAAHSASLTLP